MDNSDIYFSSFFQGDVEIQATLTGMGLRFYTYDEKCEGVGEACGCLGE